MLLEFFECVNFFFFFFSLLSFFFFFFFPSSLFSFPRVVRGRREELFRFVYGHFKECENILTRVSNVPVINYATVRRIKLVEIKIYSKRRENVTCCVVNGVIA